MQADRFRAFTGRRANAMLAADTQDALNGHQFLSGRAGMLRKLERSRSDNDVRSDLVRRVEVPFERGILHELRGTEIGEPRSANAVSAKVVTGRQIEAGQIIDRISIFSTRQSSHHHRPGIPGVQFDVGVQVATDSRNHRLAFRIRRLLAVGRWHLPLFQHTCDTFPVAE